MRVIHHYKMYPNRNDMSAYISPIICGSSIFIEETDYKDWRLGGAMTCRPTRNSRIDAQKFIVLKRLNRLDHVLFDKYKYEYLLYSLQFLPLA